MRTVPETCTHRHQPKQASEYSVPPRRVALITRYLSVCTDFFILSTSPTVSSHRSIQCDISFSCSTSKGNKKNSWCHEAIRNDMWKRAEGPSPRTRLDRRPIRDPNTEGQWLGDANRWEEKAYVDRQFCPPFD